MALLIYPSYADPDADVTITGNWSITTTPTQPNSLVNKTYVDSVAGSGAITVWNNTSNYVVGQMVTSSNAIWCARFNNINSQPSLVVNTWRQMANLDAAQNFNFARTVTANTTLLKSDTAIIANTTAGGFTLILPTITSLRSLDTPGRVLWLRIIKQGQPGTLVVNTSSPDTFSDSSVTQNLVAQGVYNYYCMFDGSFWYKGV